MGSSPCRVVEHLLRKDSSASVRDMAGYSPVHYAALHGHKLALEMLLDAAHTDLLGAGGGGRGPRTPPLSPLHLAVSI